MSPVLDNSQSSEFSEPYRLLAPLVLLSFPSSTALPSLRPSEAPRSWRRLAAEKRSIGRQLCQGTAKDRDGPEERPGWHDR